MKKYVTFVKDEEESRKVQEALFKAGFEWYSSGEKVTNLTCSFIRVNEYQSGALETGVTFTVIAELLSREEYSAINAASIISDPFQLDGATKPETMIMIGGKEISESTIKAALQEYVK